MRIFVADIGGTAIKMAIANEKGELANIHEIPTNAHLGGQSIIDTVSQHILQARNIDAIGISTAGQVDSETGTIIYANENIPHYTGMPIRQLIQEKINIPLAVDNDVNCAAIGEAQYGAGMGHKDFLCLTYGTGIGGAIVKNGAIDKGKDGIAAEFGHMITHGGGRNCNCGGKGCYERYASTSALMTEAHLVDPTIANGRQLFDEIEKGNEQLESVVNEWIEEVSYGLVTLTHIFNPGLIIVGGGVMERQLTAETVERRTKEMMMDSFQSLQIKQARLGNRAGLYGAVHIAKKAYEQTI